MWAYAGRTCGRILVAFMPAGKMEAFFREVTLALFNAGIPATAFGVDDIEVEYQRMREWGVEFRGEPSKPESGPSTVVLNDTCGNWIALFQL